MVVFTLIVGGLLVFSLQMVIFSSGGSEVVVVMVVFLQCWYDGSGASRCWWVANGGVGGCAFLLLGCK